MNTDTNPRNSPGAGNARLTAASRRTLITPHLNPKYFGLALGVTGLVFYLGCMLTMATVPHESAVIFFSSLLHGIDVEPVLKTSIPLHQVALGLVTTFILAWFAGVLIAGIYNLSIRMGNNPETT